MSRGRQHRVLKPALAIGLGLGSGAVTGACFSQDATLGLPCTTARACGRRQECIDGICQRAGEDPRYCAQQEGVVDLGSEFPLVTSELVRTDALELLGDCGAFRGDQAVYLWEAPFTADFSARIRVDTAYWLVNENLPFMQSRNGGCTGRAETCAPAADGSISFAADRGDIMVITLDGLNPNVELSNYGYSLTIQEASSCISSGGSLASTVPLRVQGTTVGAEDTLQPATCDGIKGVGYGPDVAFSWTAPRTGIFAFNAVSDDANLLVYLLAGDCGGQSLACADDLGFSGAASASVPLIGGQEVVIVVDSATPGPGAAFELSIGEAFGCVPQGNDLGFQFPPGGVVADASQAEPTSIVTCAPPDAPQLIYSWTAPAAAFWTFDTSRSAAEVELSVLEGSCSGPVVGCDAGISPTPNIEREGQVVLPLDTGQSVVIAAAPAGEGEVVITLEQTPCGSQLLATPLPIAVTGTAESRLGAVTCAENRPQLEDATFAWRAPTRGAYVFEVETDAFDPILYVLDDSCAGRQRACELDTGRIELDMVAQETVVVGVAAPGQGPGGDFELRITEVPEP